MANNRVSFCIGDIICWDNKRFPKEIRAVKRKLGKGPFSVVGVRTISLKQRQKMSPRLTHPEAIKIRLINKRYIELPGDWFKKI